jgi:hypothetical protein
MIASTHNPKLNARLIFAAFLNLGGSSKIHVERIPPQLAMASESAIEVERLEWGWTLLTFHVPMAGAEVKAPMVC